MNRLHRWFLHWYERVIRRRDRRMSEHWIATWEQHEKEIAGGWEE